MSSPLARTTVTVVENTATRTSTDAQSGLLDFIVPGSSRVVAVFSVIPFCLIFLVFCGWFFFAARSRRGPGRLHDEVRWKPKFLRWQPLLILSGVVVALIILLESAKLAIPDQQTAPAAASTTAASTSNFYEPAASTATTISELLQNTVGLLSSESMPTDPSVSEATRVLDDRDVSSTKIDEAPPPTGGWLSIQDGPSPSETGAPPSNVGWLSDPDDESGSVSGAPPPSVGWLSLNKDSSLSSSTVYFIGTFLPILIASLLSIPWKILSLEVTSLEPFAQLASPGGGKASETLALHDGGGLNPFTALFGKRPSVTLSLLLKYGSTLLIPLAAESIHLRLEGNCHQDWRQKCTATLASSHAIIRVAQAVLALMGFIAIGLMFLLRKETYGVSFDPRSILGIARLSMSPPILALIRGLTLGPNGMYSSSAVADALGDRKFALGYTIHPSGQQTYGFIMLNNEAEAHSLTTTKSEFDALTQVSPSPQHQVNQWTRKRSVNLLLVKIFGFSIFILGLSILILYYRYTDKDSGFETFMNSQNTFGVRFLFTVFGVIISFGWGHIFNELAKASPAWEMSRRPTKPERCIQMPLSPNPYTGLVAYVSIGHSLLSLVSFVAMLSDVLPILLANIPFNNAITWNTFNICTWMTVAFLFTTLITLICIGVSIMLNPPSSEFPFQPADLGTISAVMYMVCRSSILQNQLCDFLEHGRVEIETYMRALNCKYRLISVLDSSQKPHVMIKVVSSV